MLTLILAFWTLGSVAAVNAEMVMLQTPEDSYTVDFIPSNDDHHIRRRTGKPRKGCVTIDGPDAGFPCVSPFKFVPTNKTYYGCTYDEAAEPWCSTKVNEFGYHLSGHWGVCSEDCPVEEIDPVFDSRHCLTKHGHKCFFPFAMEGFNYRGCVEDSGHGEHGYCFAEDKDDNLLVVRDDCTAACPKDTLLTDADLTAGQILHILMKESQTSTRNKNRKASCKDLMYAKFAKENPEDLPHPAKHAKTWTEALKLVCAGADYCQGEQPDGICGTYGVTNRFNILEEENGIRHQPKSDCLIRCGNPND